MPVFRVYSDLSFEARRLCHVSWAYKAIETYIGTFVWIALYMDTRDIGVVLAYVTATIASVALSYSGGAFIFAKYGMGSRHIFSFSFLFSFLAFITFVSVSDPWIKAVIFGTAYWLCHGLFYLGFFHNMLRHTRDRERDAYTTVRMTGSLLLDIVMPFFAAFGFFVAEFVGFADRSLVAVVWLGTLSFLSLLFVVRSFRESDPLPILRGEVFRRMLWHPRLPVVALFFSVLRMDMAVSMLSIPVLGIIVFGRPVGLGLALGAITIVTIVFILLTHRHRVPERRAVYSRWGFALEIFGLIFIGSAILVPTYAVWCYIAGMTVMPFAKNLSGMTTALYELRMAELLGIASEAGDMEPQVFRSTLIAIGRLVFVGMLIAAYLSFPTNPAVFLLAGFVFWVIALLVQMIVIRSLDSVRTLS